MYARHTIEAIVALAATDGGVTPNEVMRLENLISGRPDTAETMTCMSYREACRAIGTSLGTVKRLVKAGRISVVMGTGGRALGISRSGLNDFLKGTTKR